MKELINKAVCFLIAMIIVFGTRYLFVTLMFELIAYAFNLAFSWKTALGIWAIAETNWLQIKKSVPVLKNTSTRFEQFIIFEKFTHFY